MVKHHLRIHPVEDAGHAGSRLLGSTAQSVVDTIDIIDSAPALGNQAFLGDIEVEQV